MNGFDEKKYEELLQKIPNVSTHSERASALQQVKQEKKRKKVVMNALLTAAMLCLSLLGMIRYSSTFAYAVAQLPGMKPLVEMIALDKGIKDIVDNEYYEEMNASQTIDGHTVSITGVVADESGMIISYKIQSKKDLANIVRIPTVELLLDGKPMDNIMIGGSWGARSEGTFETEDTIEAIASQPLDYGTREFQLQLTVPYLTEKVFEIPFTLEKEIKPSKRIAINKEITMDGQKMTVHEIILSPIRSQLVLSIDPNNTMEILHFENIQLYDEKGEQWGKIRNGIVGIGSLEDEEFSLMLESNYFRIPKSFEIVFEEVEAIPKKDAFVTIDWDTKEVLSQPSMIKVNLEVKDAYEITYSLSPYKKNEHKAVFGQMIDAEGTVYHSNSTWISDTDNGQQVGQFYEVETPPINPVKLKVSRYENYLNEKGRIKVNVQ